MLWLQSMIDALRFTAGYAEEHVLHFIGVESSYLAEKISMPLIKILCTSVIHIIPKGIFKLFARKEICFLLFKFSIHNFFCYSYFYLIIMNKMWIVSNYWVLNLCIEILSSNLFKLNNYTNCEDTTYGYKFRLSNRLTMRIFISNEKQILGYILNAQICIKTNNERFIW